MSTRSHRAEPQKRIAVRNERGSRQPGRRIRTAEVGTGTPDPEPARLAGSVDTAVRPAPRRARAEAAANPGTEWALEMLTTPVGVPHQPKRRREDVVYDNIAVTAVTPADAIGGVRYPSALAPAPRPREHHEYDENWDPRPPRGAPSFGKPTEKKKVTGIRSDHRLLWLGVVAVVVVAVVAVLSLRGGSPATTGAAGPGLSGALDSLSSAPGVAMVLPTAMPDGYRWRGQTTFVANGGVVSSRTSTFEPTGSGSPEVEVCVQSQPNQCLRGDVELSRKLGSLDVRINLNGSKGMAAATKFWQNVDLDQDLSSTWLKG